MPPIWGSPASPPPEGRPEQLSAHKDIRDDRGPCVVARSASPRPTRCLSSRQGVRKSQGYMPTGIYKHLKPVKQKLLLSHTCLQHWAPPQWGSKVGTRFLYIPKDWWPVLSTVHTVSPKNVHTLPQLVAQFWKWNVFLVSAAFVIKGCTYILELHVEIWSRATDRFAIPVSQANARGRVSL